MPKPNLSLPADPFGRIYRILADAVKNDPTIRRLGINVIDFDGAGSNESGPITKLPAVRLSMRPQRSTHDFSEDGQTLSLKCPFQLFVETFSEGSRLEDSTRLGFAVLNALYPEDEQAMENLEDALATAGLQTREVEQLWFGIDPIGAATIQTAPVSLYSKGWLNLMVHLELSSRP